MQTLAQSPAPPGDAASTWTEAAYGPLVQRLSHASVAKYYRAYEDVPWDDPGYAIDPADPRFIFPETTLMQTSWAREQSTALCARLGLHTIATFMKLGAQFENVLSRGLLEFAATLPNEAPEFRYAYHEVIEESNHSLMFQEFVNRAGLPVSGLSALQRMRTHAVTPMGRRFPELFFIFVLGGEEPIDYQQRELVLRSEREQHPLLRRVCQIHVTEEARHISFARAYLRRHVPALSPARMLRLRISVPLILGSMARVMMQPSPDIVREYAIPRAVLREAYVDNPQHRQQTHDALAPLAELCRELDILRRPYDTLWRYQGLIA